MKPAVIMMFRDEADILGKCLEHWYNLGVRDFYLCDNGSVDDSMDIARKFTYKHHLFDAKLYTNLNTDWPGRRVINDLKNRALDDGCDWIFPADADEFLVLPEPYWYVEDWILDCMPKWTIDSYCWGGLRYVNMLPDGREYWQEPQRKVFGRISKDWNISMGNHLIESIDPSIKTDAYYKHYSLRTYAQFRRKIENYMNAFSQLPFPDHKHTLAYHQWQKEGEAFIQRRWEELTGPDAIQNGLKE